MTPSTQRPLRINYENLEIPHADCGESAAALAKRGESDECYVIMTVTDRTGTQPSENGPDTYRIRFDRNLQKFDLSLRQSGEAGEFVNSQDAITWFISHGDETAKVLDIVKVLGATLSSAGVASKEMDRRNKNAVFPLVLANYIVTGRIVFPQDTREIRDIKELESTVLDVFANSDPASVQDFIGKVSFFKGDPTLASGARERAAHVDSILGLVPRYRAFLENIITPEILSQLSSDDPKTVEHMRQIETFVAQIMTNLGAGRVISFDVNTFEASKSYEELSSGVEKARDFCSALAHAEAQDSKKRGSKLGKNFVEECRVALPLVNKPADQAAVLSLKAGLLSASTQKQMRDVLEDEVGKNNAELPWLSKKRPQIDRVVDLVLKHTKIKVEYEKLPEGPRREGEPKPRPVVKSMVVFIDTPKLKNDLEKHFKGEPAVTHREPVVAALAVLKILFYDLNHKGFNPAFKDKVRVFVEGEYREVPLKFSQEPLTATQKLIERDLGRSLKRSDRDWIIAQGTVGGAGALSLGLGLGLRPSQAPKGVRQGLFIGGSTAVGCALGSLVQRSKRAHNKHIWGGVGCAVGAAVFGTASALIGTQTNLFNGPGGGGTMPPDTNPPGPGQRWPTDEHGP